MEDLSFWYTSPDFLVKVAIFALIQVLVYLILTNSSSIFSAEEKNGGSNRIRSSRSASIRRLIAGVSELPAGGDFTSASCSSSACAAAVSGAFFGYDFVKGLVD